MKPQRERDEFFLDEFVIQVDVCGEEYFVTDPEGNVNTDREEAFQFTKSGAERVITKHLPDENCELVEAETSMYIPND